MSSSTENRPEAPLDAAFGAAARRLRLARGLTISEAVQRMNAIGGRMHDPTLSTLETGARRWTTRYIALVCAALEADPLELVLELLPPDTAQLAAAHQAGGAAAVAGWLAQKLK